MGDGDNNVLMQQVSKALLTEYMAAKKQNKPFKGLGLEHMNKSSPVIPSQLSSSVIRSIEFQFFNLSGVISFLKTWPEPFSGHVILLTFVEAETTLKDDPLKTTLALLRSMYTLVTLEEDAAFR